MSKLITLTDLNISNFMNLIQDSNIVVYENIQGSKIFINYNGSEFILKARNLSSQPINMIDLALQKYYNKALDYLNGLDSRVKLLLPVDWWFCFQYFYDEKPANIKYDKIPENSLILTSIVKDNRFVFDSCEIKEYSELIGVEPQPLIFEGTLSDKQLDMINYFLKTSSDDLEYIFGEENFSYFFYKILSPDKNNSILMSNGKYHDNIEKIIIKTRDSELSLALLNPMYRKTSNNKSGHADIYSILLLDFIEFIQTLDINDITLIQKTSDSLYVELISKLFNYYCNNRMDKIMNYDFIIPPFFYEDKFKLNIDRINNENTRKFIQKCDRLEYFFKIILGSFRIQRKKTIGTFTNRSLELFNDVVVMLSNTIHKTLKIKRENSLNSSDLLDFDKFYKIQYPKDGEGMVYPDLYREIEQDVVSNKKKKKAIIKK